MKDYLKDYLNDLSILKESNKAIIKKLIIDHRMGEVSYDEAKAFFMECYKILCHREEELYNEFVEEYDDVMSEAEREVIESMEEG